MFGIHEATNGETYPFSENVDVVCEKKMYTNANEIPTARLIPIPPRRFFDESDKAKTVKIIVENGTLKRLFNSFSYVFTLAEPFAFCF